jgi:hypothetical protein
MGTFRRMTAVLVTALAALALVACSASSSSSVSSVVSSATGALEQAKTDVCGRLADAQTAVDSAKAGNGEDLASTAASLATDLTNAASLLKTVGATDAANDVQSLATDMQNLATATPDPGDLGAERPGRLGLDPRPRRVVHRLDRHRDRVTTTDDVDLPRATQEEVVVGVLVALDHREPDRSTERMAVGAVSNLADVFAVAVELLVAVQQRLGVGDENLHHP